MSRESRLSRRLIVEHKRYFQKNVEWFSQKLALIRQYHSTGRSITFMSCLKRLNRANFCWVYHGRMQTFHLRTARN